LYSPVWLDSSGPPKAGGPQAFSHAAVKLF